MCFCGADHEWCPCRKAYVGTSTIKFACQYGQSYSFRTQKKYCTEDDRTVTQKPSQAKSTGRLKITTAQKIQLSLHPSFLFFFLSFSPSPVLIRTTLFILFDTPLLCFWWRQSALLKFFPFRRSFLRKAGSSLALPAAHLITNHLSDRSLTRPDWRSNTLHSFHNKQRSHQNNHLFHLPSSLLSPTPFTQKGEI